MRWDAANQRNLLLESDGRWAQGVAGGDGASSAAHSHGATRGSRTAQY